MKHHAYRVANLLCERGLLPREKLEEAVEALKKGFEDERLMSWTVGDVRSAVGNNRLPTKTCRAALDQAFQDHDCNDGINWYSLVTAVDRVKAREKNDKKKKQGGAS
jgi:hypothetical protein